MKIEYSLKSRSGISDFEWPFILIYFPNQIKLVWEVKKGIYKSKNVILRHFAIFYFSRLNFCVKNELKLLKNSKFSIFDKSADMADINDRQVI